LKYRPTRIFGLQTIKYKDKKLNRKSLTQVETKLAIVLGLGKQGDLETEMLSKCNRLGTIIGDSEAEK